MRVLLIIPAASRASTAGYYRRMLAPMPPISLAYLAAALERAGVDVRVHDEEASGDVEAAVRILRPDVVGLSVVTATMPDAARVVRVVRSVSRQITVVLGNIHADVFFDQLLRDGTADVVVRGEGEQTLVELVRCLAETWPDLERVAGIAYMADGQVRSTTPRPRLQDLDSLPFPAWHLFPLQHYRLFDFARVRDPGVLIQGSRGCPYGCTYCSLKIMGNSRRCRSPESIADEFEYLYDRFGFLQPSFIDPIFPFSRDEGLAFARELTRRGLQRRQVWITETRTDLVDRELLCALREAGLRRIMFGFESATQHELRALKKSASVDRSAEAVAMARKARLQVIGFFMLGIPGATRASMQATIDHARALDVDFAKFNIFVPFPGTAVHDELLAAHKIQQPEDWRRYTSFPSRSCPPNYVPDGLSGADLIRFQRRAYRSFYVRPRMILRHLLRIRTLTPGNIFDGARALLASRLEA